METARRNRNCPALDQERNQHHHETDVEEDQRVAHADQERDRGEENADGAAQTDPADEQALRQAEAHRQQAQRHRQRPCNEHQCRCDRQRRPGRTKHLVRRDKQAQQQEHRRLRGPGEAFPTSS